MRKYLVAFLSVFVLLLQSCVQEGTYEVTGNLSLPDGAVITLWPDDHYHQIAGTVLKDNKFSLAIEGLQDGVYDVIISWPDPNFWDTKKKNGSFIATPDSLYTNLALYLESGQDYHITTTVTDYKTVFAATSQNLYPYPLTVKTGSPNTNDLHQIQQKWQKITVAYRKKMDSLNVLTRLYQDKNDMASYGRTMILLQGLDKNFYQAERFKATKNFIENHKASAISAYLIATAPNLREDKKYFESALKQLDPSLKDSRYTKEAQRRVALN
ncbi:MAG: hypothetical protein V4687_17035 [Bacteroidota bacterium]